MKELKRNRNACKTKAVFTKLIAVKKWPLFLKIIFFILILILCFDIVLKCIPSKKLNEFCSRQYSTRIYDRNGILLQVIPLGDGLRREYIPLKKIQKSVIKAFLEAEDKNFYAHPGIDLLSVARAYSQNKQAGRIVSGASTITMQLVRIIYPRDKNTAVTVKTKIAEMFKAFYLEAKFSKKEILELYLNNVPFGFQAEGIATAARTFFGTDVASLSDAQIKTLAQIPRRPSEYAPERNYVYPQLCPHFVNYVLGEYRKNNIALPDEIHLSIDSELNEQVSSAIQRKIMEYQEARIHNGAAFVINNHTGEIITWVGNGNFYDEHGGQIDGVTVRNQPGSSMKPFLYALGLERGFAPATVLPDIPMDFGGEKVYVPLNFNNRYNGPVRYRIALASSLNIPAVYLLYRIGVNDYMEKLSQLQFDSLEGERGSTGLSIALGSSEVTLYEMVHAFSVFANDGYMNKVTFEKQKPSLSDTRSFTKVYESDTARIICNMLSDDSARELGFGHSKTFSTQYDSMFKTGTSNQFQNIIALGATTEFTAGVWMGNFEGETVVRQTGSSIPASIVRQILDELTAEYGAGSFLQPQTYEKKRICVLSGMSAGENCPSVTEEYVLKENKEEQICTWHNKSNGHVQITYPSEYQHWASGQNMSGNISTGSSLLQIIYPTNGASFVYDSSIPQSQQMLRVQATGGSSNRAQLFVDDIFFGEAEGRLYWNVPLERGRHTLRVECNGEQTEIYFAVF